MYIITDGTNGMPGPHTTTTKLDSGAIINLAHQKHCNNIKSCSEYDLPPIKLSGIGGQTDALTKVGKVTALVRGQKKTALAYIMNEQVAGTKEICLLGLKNNPNSMGHRPHSPHARQPSWQNLRAKIKPSLQLRRGQKSPTQKENKKIQHLQICPTRPRILHLRHQRKRCNKGSIFRHQKNFNREKETFKTPALV